MQDPAVKMALRTYSKEGIWAVIGPGGVLHPTKFIDWGGHLMVEGFLVMLCMYMLMLRAHKIDESELVLKDREIEDLVREWEPAPLVKRGVPPASAPPRVEAVLGAHTVVAGRKCVNCASMDFLGIQGDPEITAQCERAMDKYGVGSCGPRGFYGTFDVHLSLEERMARFMGVEDATLYAYDAATVSSVIPCFCKKGDRIVADASVNFGIQTGILLSRSEVAHFEHNNVSDLRRILEEFQKKDGKRELTRPTFRKFLAIEGIYANSGDVAPLREIFDLAKEFKYRIVMDESFSLGVLGRRGRGLSEEVGLEPRDIDIIVASLGNSLASVGGVCMGTTAMNASSKLNSSGYVFSASLPPFLAVAAQAAIDKLDAEPQRLERLQTNARLMRRELGGMKGARVLGNDERCPLIHLEVDHPQAVHPDAFSPQQKQEQLERLVDVAIQEGVLVDVATFCSKDRSAEFSTLRVTVTAEHSDRDVRRCARVLRDVCSARS
jgi:serine palmitoyltransferase